MNFKHEEMHKMEKKLVLTCFRTLQQGNLQNYGYNFGFSPPARWGLLDS